MIAGSVAAIVPAPNFTPMPSRPHFSSSWDMEFLWEFNKKYLGHPEYDSTASSLGKLFHNAYLALSSIGNDIHTNECTLLCLSFGQPSTNHSFL